MLHLLIFRGPLVTGGIFAWQSTYCRCLTCDRKDTQLLPHEVGLWFCRWTLAFWKTAQNIPQAFAWVLIWFGLQYVERWGSFPVHECLFTKSQDQHFRLRQYDCTYKIKIENSYSILFAICTVVHPCLYKVKAWKLTPGDHQAFSLACVYLMGILWGGGFSWSFYNTPQTSTKKASLQNQNM